MFTVDGVLHPCCSPGAQRGVPLSQSFSDCAERIRATKGSLSGMVRLPAGTFLMGTESDEAFPQDGEGPVREVIVDSFYIDTYPVTNAQFGEFVTATAYETESERF